MVAIAWSLKPRYGATLALVAITTTIATVATTATTIVTTVKLIILLIFFYYYITVVLHSIGPHGIKFRLMFKLVKCSWGLCTSLLLFILLVQLGSNRICTVNDHKYG